MTDPQAAPKRKKGLGFAKTIYVPRTIAFATLSVGIAPALAQRAAPGWVYGLLFLFGLVWAHVAFQCSVRSAAPIATEYRNLKLDALFCGFWAMAMGGNPVPTLLMVAVLLLDNATVGGITLLAASLVALVLGAAIAGLLLGWHLTLTSDHAVWLACLPFLLIYPPTIGLLMYQHVTRVQREKSRFRDLNRLDALSGLHSRAYWELRLEEIFERCRRQKQHAVLILLDIDRFKEVNDNFGHLLGDEAIRFLGGILSRELRPGDLAGRIGGDEFGILLPDAGAAEATGLIHRLQRTLTEHRFEHRETGFVLTLSFGVAELSAALTSTRDWVHRADEALYRAKRGGRNTIRSFPTTAADDPAAHP